MAEIRILQTKKAMSKHLIKRLVRDNENYFAEPLKDRAGVFALLLTEFMHKDFRVTIDPSDDDLWLGPKRTAKGL